ncbi:phospholipase domain-containing protein, partial [Streptomyces sp. NPDC054841]
ARCRGAPPGRAWPCSYSAADARGWYDIEVTADGDSGFRRRLMGHIENGRPSVSG